MEITVTLTQRTGVASAIAEYDGNRITVLAGGKISPDFANHIRGGKTAKAYRDNPEYVDENALSVSVKRLRDKLGAEHAIRTVYGIGYRWE